MTTMTTMTKTNPYPVLMLVGPAGSGKDTIAAALCKKLTGAVDVAQADPMKRLAAKLFGFTKAQLWGPSMMRNAVDPAWTSERMTSALRDYNAGQHLPLGVGDFVNRWLQDLFQREGGDYRQEARTHLECWYHNVLLEGVKRGALTPRLVLQTLGTEWGRAFSRNMWVDYALRIADQLLGDPTVDYECSIGVCERVEGPLPPLVVITDGRFRNEVLAVRRLGGSVWQVAPPSPSTADVQATAAAGVASHISEAEQAGIPQQWYTLKVVNDKSLGLAALASLVEDASTYLGFSSFSSLLPIVTPLP